MKPVRCSYVLNEPYYQYDKNYSNWIIGGRTIHSYEIVITPQLIVIMASIRIIPIVLLSSIFAVKSLHILDNYKNSISFNGFGEKDVLEVILDIYDNANESTGKRRVLRPKDFMFNHAFVYPNVTFKELPEVFLFSGVVFVKFSKNLSAASNLEDLFGDIRLHVLAANRSHIEVTENTKPNFNGNTYASLTDEEKKDLKSAVYQMINESPEFEMTFTRTQDIRVVIGMSLAELKESQATYQQVSYVCKSAFSLTCN